MIRFENRTLKIAAFALSTALVGCGAFDTKDKGEKAKENDQGLNGTWQDSCVKLDFLGLARQRETLKFSAVGDFDRTTTIYSDDACNSSSLEIATNGTYAKLAGSSTAPEATDINFTVTKATVTPKSDDAVKLLNDASYCGVSNWAKDQATDVLDKNCLGKDHKKGEVVYDVYKLEDNDKKLTLGKSSLWLDKSDAGARPDKLDTDNFFSRQ